ncbi:DUF5110 domain-containing protein [bacterium]|nr:DUF5110 domain-containing protein [bacterium]
MKQLLLTVLLGFSLMQASSYNPVADEKALVFSDQVRFTVLTSGLIRMEWSKDNNFEDKGSLAFINRHLPVPHYEKSISDSWLMIKTDKMELNYKTGTGKFNKNNLVISFNLGDKVIQWKPGQKNEGNLLGTIRTLDGFDGAIMNWSTKKKIQLDEGLLSRDGWVMIDDSRRPLFDNSEWQWVEVRPDENQQDYYFFAYAHDYKQALKDFTKVAGKIALPPKFVFGSWFSRYWEYTDMEMRELVNEFKIHDVPLDVLVVDMDWHITTKPEWYKKGKKIKDQAGERMGWTGFSWNKNYFPDPKDFLQWTEKEGLKVCMNLHPASGIQPHEDKYPEMARAMGIDPESKKYIPFDIVNKDFANNFMKTILHPMEKDGVDFWWLDWQQWSTTTISGVNPTFYLNYVFFSDLERRNEKRPLIFHRYGGLGNHRYQIGFSGDAFINWKSLDYQPYFTSTAANVGFGYWSHDIGGHMRGESTPELYTRWVQFGAFSPILRTHATKANYTGGIERKIWNYPIENFYAMRDAFHLRYALIPYIYTAARESYDSGISLCRPMYYEYPENDNAYNFKNQYMFGDNLIISPITEAMDENSLFVEKQLWIPKGEWIEWHSGESVEGDDVYTGDYTINDVPIFVKPGSIIPMQSKKHYKQVDSINPLILSIFPGESGHVDLYDDEGNNSNYKNGDFTITPIHFTKKNGTDIDIVIEAVKGNFELMPEVRAYEIRLPLATYPKKLSINGEAVDYSKDGGQHTWNYDGQELMSCIFTKMVSVHEKIHIQITLSSDNQTLLSGKKGQFKKLMKFAKFLAKNNWDKSKYSNDLIVHAAQTGYRITLNPQNIVSELERFDKDWKKILKQIKKASKDKPIYLPYLELLKY